MNYGKLLAWVSVVLCYGACIGYWAAGDYKRSLYYFFAGCITIVVNA